MYVVRCMFAIITVSVLAVNRALFLVHVVVLSQRKQTGSSKHSRVAQLC